MKFLPSGIKGWNGIKNGELMKLLIANRFDTLLTFDKNLQHQQNFGKYTLTVFVLHAKINTYAVLTGLSAGISQIPAGGILPSGPVIIAI